MILLIITNTIIFLLIAGIHFYWAFGGRWGANAVLPTQMNGKNAFNPSTLATMTVAFGLLVLAFITLNNIAILYYWIDKKYICYGNWVITAIFYLRAIGDFHYVGFTKQIKGSAFATNDTKFYSPLCFVIASISLAIAISTN